MKTTITITELRQIARNIIKELFSEVIKSDDKELWKKVLQWINNHIEKLKIKLVYETSLDNIQRYHEWEQVRNILNKQFGNKFIKKI